MSKVLPSKKKISFVILFVITTLYVGFIWWHSTLNAADSTVESTNVLKFLIDFCRMIGINAELTDHIVRKSAHFCEFALLGFLSLWTAYLYNRRIIKNLMSVGFVCLGTAVVDELIQIGSLGRSAEVPDVALDFCGALFGSVFLIVIVLIIRLFKKLK